MLDAEPGRKLLVTDRAEFVRQVVADGARVLGYRVGRNGGLSEPARVELGDCRPVHCGLSVLRFPLGLRLLALAVGREPEPHRVAHLGEPPGVGVVVAHELLTARAGLTRECAQLPEIPAALRHAADCGLIELAGAAGVVGVVEDLLQLADAGRERGDVHSRRSRRVVEVAVTAAGLVPREGLLGLLKLGAESRAVLFSRSGAPEKPLVAVAGECRLEVG